MEIILIFSNRKWLISVKIRPFRYGNAYASVYDSKIRRVKIRPFRYGNFITFSTKVFTLNSLKSDRFGMEMYVIFSFF